MKATLSNFRQSPRKVRLVADMIRGKSVSQANELLTFVPKKASPEIKKLLASAIANAQVKGMGPETLFVKTITVNKGTVLRRFTPKARGRAGRINRTMSIIALELGSTGTPMTAKKGAAKKTAKTAPKARAKKVATQ